MLGKDPFERLSRERKQQAWDNVAVDKAQLLEAASTLPEDERLELASELIASADGPSDGDWESAWVAELDRRVEAARDKGEPAPEWSEVRARMLAQDARP